MTEISNLIEQLASATVEENKKEKRVSFASKGLRLDTEEDAKDIVKAINDCPGMTVLQLEGNTIGVGASKAISKALEKQSNFKKALWKDIFTQRTVSEIPEALINLAQGVMLANAKLVYLDLSDNAFGPRALAGIVKLLESPSCYTLQELYLNNNGLGIQGAKILADALCKCLENSERDGCRMALKKFVCGRNRLENEGASAVAKFFKQLGTLESVTMTQNGTCVPGVKDLADAFSANPNLQEISLEDNSLTEEGAKCVADCLMPLKDIKILDFGDCLIRTGGALHLANALENSCPDLRELHLSYNEIKLEGGIALVKSIRNKSNFAMLLLNGNHFGEDGCEIIKQKMSEFGISTKLGSLSGDEDDDDDEDEQDNESSSSINQNKSTEIVIDSKSTNSIYTSPSEFILNPTSEGLISLQKAEADLLSTLPQEPTFEDYLNLFSVICSVVKPDNDSKSAAWTYVNDILASAFKQGAEDLIEFNNSFMVCLGLIKGEDKKPPKGMDVSGAFLVLETAVKESYFHSSTRSLLKFFLSQPLLYVTCCEKARHGLLKSLYQS